MPAIAQESQSPAGAIVRINRETGGHCTGFATDRMTVVTAAHCLWLARPRNWIQPTSLHILTGYDSGQFRQHLRVLSYRVSAEFAPGSEAERPGRGADWAVLRLDAPFIGRPLPLAGQPPPRGLQLALAGYAGARAPRLTVHPTCMTLAVEGFRFLHGCPAGNGQSGAPLFGWEGGRQVAFGLHSASNETKGLAVAAVAILDGRSRRPY